MRVIAAAIRNPIAVAVTVLLVCLFGALSLQQLPLQLFPDIERPTIGIFTNWRGASPEEAEAELLEPQERVLQGLSGLEEITGNANSGGTEIILTFAIGTDMKAALVDVIGRMSSGVQSFLLPPPACDSPEVLALLRNADARWVAISPANAEIHPLSVSADHYDIACRMTSRLLELGHREIVFIAGDPSSKGGAERLRGHLRSMSLAGIHDCRIEPGLFTFQSGLDATERLLAAMPQCTAIIACNDDMAAAAISVAHRHHLRVPEDITVVGFDDTPIASIVSPAITTARQPIAEMAQSAIRMLHATSAETQPPEEKRTQKVLPCTLIERESSAPPRQPEIQTRRGRQR